MSDINRVTIIGRLTREVEIKSTSTGMVFGRFSIASDNGYGDKKKTGFYDCVVWKGQAENMAKYTHKGSKVCVDGSLSFSSWEHDGKKHSKVEISCQHVQFLDSKQDGQSQPQSTAETMTTEFDGTPAEPFNDDLPF